MAIAAHRAPRRADARSVIVSKFGMILIIFAIVSATQFLPRTEASFVFIITALLGAINLVQRTLIAYLFTAHTFITYIVPTVLRWYFSDILLQFGPEPYVDALQYCAWYVAVFAAAHTTFAPRAARTSRYGAIVSDASLMMIVLLFAASLAAKFALYGYRLFHPTDVIINSGLSSGAFTGVLTAVSEAGLVALLLLGMKSCARRSGVMPLYIAVILISLAVGFLSGSRLALVQVIFATVLIELRRNSIAAMTLGGVGLVISLYLFGFMLLYRGVNYDLDLAIVLWASEDRSLAAIVDNIFADRFNYVQVVQHVFDRIQSRSYLLTDYSDNITGLIPRALWPDKPLIGLNLNEVAATLGLIALEDHETSIGMGVIGESYYQLKQLGLAVAAAQGVAFAFLRRLALSRSSLRYSSYVALSIIVVVRDSYLYIVPLLATYAVVLIAFWTLARRGGFTGRPAASRRMPKAVRPAAPPLRWSARA